MTHDPPGADDALPWDQVGRLLSGELSPEEEARLFASISTDPAQQELLAALREVWAAAAPGNPSRDPEQVLEAIRRRDASPVRELRRHPRFTAAPRTAPRPIRRALAAAAILALGLGGWWMLDVVRPFGGRLATAASAFKEYRTTRGQRLTLTLPDGATAMLGPETVLRYPATYGDSTRTVELRGEAYFDVTHDAARPFVVRAGNAVARDLGTRFVVRARDGEPAVDVAVAEGRVALSGADRPISDAVLLDPRDVGRVQAAGAASVRHGVSLARYFGWTEGGLVFEGTPLSTVVAELNRWYDADVRLAGDGLADQTLTAEFHNEPISKVLPMIQASLGLELRHSGRQYILSAR